MQLKSTQQLELPATADMHVHLRQGELMELMVPTVRQGGVDTAFVYGFSPKLLKGYYGYYLYLC